MYRFCECKHSLNSHAYEKSLLLGFIKKLYLLLLFKSKSESIIYDHFVIVLAVHAQHKTLSNF